MPPPQNIYTVSIAINTQSNVWTHLIVFLHFHAIVGDLNYELTQMELSS